MADNLLDMIEEKRKEYKKKQNEEGIGTLVGLRDMLQRKAKTPYAPKEEQKKEKPNE